MQRQARRCASVILAFVPLLAIIHACSDNPVTQQINEAPQTEVRASSPRAEDGGFVVEFVFSGSDVDGHVDFFEWRTLETTMEEQPWTRTYDHELTLWFPENPSNVGFREVGTSRVLQVRAVDNAGLMDPTAAQVDFTPLTLAPEVFLSVPPQLVGANSCLTSGRRLTFRWTATDDDSKSGAPEFIRYALISPNDIFYGWERDACLTRFEFAAVNPFLRYQIDWSWSNWIPYDPNADASDPSRMVAFPPRDFGESYFFAVQARDIDGATSRSFDWNEQVIHFRVQNGKAPVLTVDEAAFGEGIFVGTFSVASHDINAGQNLNFSWTADASAYLGEIDGYRYGWDVLDANNADDPGWVVGWGDWAQAPAMSFDNGVHSFVVQTRDNSGQVTRATYELTVVSP